MLNRRTGIVAAVAAALTLSLAIFFMQGMSLLVQQLGGAYKFDPEDAPWVLSDSAQALVDKAYEGIDKASVIDQHVQVISLGQRADTDDFVNRSFVNPDLQSGFYPRNWLRSKIYFSAAGSNEDVHADDFFLSRLARQVQALPGPHTLKVAALDQRYNSEGKPLPGDSAYYVDNDYVWALSQQRPKLFTPVVSIHPYRQDAIKALEKWAKRGVKTILWSPDLQAIDPADKRLDKFYQALIDNKMTLLTRNSEALTMGNGEQAYGNPLRYRHALEKGVRIIMAQCGGTAHYPDPDDESAKPRPGYEWFLALMENPETGKNLYGDISGLTSRNALPDALTTVLQHPQIFDHLLYASNYPLPAINRMINIDTLTEDGFITDEQATGLREIYNVNPLLFDFVLQRLVRLPHTDLGFPAAVFTRDVAR